MASAEMTCCSGSLKPSRSDAARSYSPTLHSSADSASTCTTTTTHHDTHQSINTHHAS